MSNVVIHTVDLFVALAHLDGVGMEGIANDAFVMTIHATQESLVRKVILHHTSDVGSVLKDIEGMEFNVGLYHVSKTLRRATREWSVSTWIVHHTSDVAPVQLVSLETAQSA